MGRLGRKIFGGLSKEEWVQQIGSKVCFHLEMSRKI